MAFQFKTRSKDSNESDPQVTWLRERNSGLAKQLDLKNQQVRILREEIQKLSQIQKEWQRKTYSSQVSSSFLDNKESSLIKQQYQELKTKYEQLLMQNSSLTTKIITSQSSRITLHDSQKRRLNQKIQQYQRKISLLDSKVVNYQREIAQLKDKRDKAISFSYKDQTFQVKIKALEGQIRYKDQEIQRLQREKIQKQEQLNILRRDIQTYIVKVDSLSDQLSKISTQKVQVVRYVQREQIPYLKSKLAHLGNINGALFTENNNLKRENTILIEKLKDLERRIHTLQQTNISLQGELRATIQQRKQSSRATTSKDNEHQNLINSLKAQISQLMSFNQLVRQQNDELYGQLKLFKEGSRCNRCKNCHSKVFSKSPNGKSQASRTKIITTDHISSPFNVVSRRQTRLQTHNYSSISCQKKKEDDNYLVKSTVGAKMEERDYHYRIQALQNENTHLRQQLYSQNKSVY